MPLFDSNAVVSTASLRREFTAATTTMFPTFCLTIAVIASGCATQHHSAQAPLPVAPAPDVSPAAAAAAPSAAVEARRVAAEAKKLNLEVVKNDGHVRYCRSNVVVGSRFDKDRQCYTADQVEAMRAQTQLPGSH
jgi:hypothetical protein